MTYVRFVIHRNDPDSGRRQGLFQAITDLRDRGQLMPHEQDCYAEIGAWFDRRLEKPLSFSHSGRAGAKKAALSWFRDSATEHISRMRAIAGILEAHGIEIDVLQSERPGYVVYEDEFQVVAEPFRETAT